MIVGDTLRITSVALVGLEGRLENINRHKQRTVVEMRMITIENSQTGSCPIATGVRKREINSIRKT